MGAINHADDPLKKYSREEDGIVTVLEIPDFLFLWLKIKQKKTSKKNIKWTKELSSLNAKNETKKVRVGN